MLSDNRLTLTVDCQCNVKLLQQPRAQLKVQRQGWQPLKTWNSMTGRYWEGKPVLYKCVIFHERLFLNLIFSSAETKTSFPLKQPLGELSSNKELSFYQDISFNKHTVKCGKSHHLNHLYFLPPRKEEFPSLFKVTCRHPLAKWNNFSYQPPENGNEIDQSLIWI